MGKRLELATEALLRLSSLELLTDEELVWKLKQAYSGESKSERVEVPDEVPVFEEERPRIKSVPVDSRARIEALRRQLR